MCNDSVDPNANEEWLLQKHQVHKAIFNPVVVSGSNTEGDNQANEEDGVQVKSKKIDRSQAANRQKTQDRLNTKVTKTRNRGRV